MRLVRIGGRAVWEVLAISDNKGLSVWDDLKGADPSDGGAEQMRARLRTDVPLNGPPKGESRCRSLGDDIFEFKEQGIRVLWFYDAGEPKERGQIICTHSCPKMSKKKFRAEKARAVRLRGEYIAAKIAGTLRKPKKEG